MALKNETLEPASAAEGADESSPSTGMEVMLRILVPASRAGSIIGKVGYPLLLAFNLHPFCQGGEFVQSLRQSSGAKIKIANTMPGCEERAVQLSSPDRSFLLCVNSVGSQ